MCHATGRSKRTLVMAILPLNVPSRIWFTAAEAIHWAGVTPTWTKAPPASAATKSDGAARERGEHPHGVPESIGHQGSARGRRLLRRDRRAAGAVLLQILDEFLALADASI